MTLDGWTKSARHSWRSMRRAQSTRQAAKGCNLMSRFRCCCSPKSISSVSSPSLSGGCEIAGYRLEISGFTDVVTSSFTVPWSLLNGTWFSVAADDWAGGTGPLVDISGFNYWVKMGKTCDATNPGSYSQINFEILRTGGPGTHVVIPFFAISGPLDPTFEVAETKTADVSIFGAPAPPQTISLNFAGL